MFKVTTIGLGALAFVVGVGACSSDSGSEKKPAAGITRELKSTAAREEPLQGAEQAAVSDLSAFAWSFYGQLEKPDGNFVFSPYSIAVASAMLSAGAASETLEQMQSALHFSSTGDALHTGQNALSRLLEARNREGNRDDNPQLIRVSNDFWMALDLMPEDAFLDSLARYYGAGVHLAPFANEPEECRREINAKVSDDTGKLIPELLPQGSLDVGVVFVLTNALYFKSHWETEFDPRLTRPGAFTTLDGEMAEADIMHQRTQAGYVAGDGFFALSLPYDGRALSMVFLVPELGNFDAFAESLDSARVDEIVLGLSPTEVELSLPKFEVSGDIPLAAELEAAGMIDAFDPARADFTALAPNIFISDAFHQAKLILNEEGTEAGAATAFVGKTTSVPPEPITVEIDRPFLFLLRDATGAPLFVGQFATPR